jgi:D-3-phosphoglycerate dehydrogenase
MKSSTPLIQPAPRILVASRSFGPNCPEAVERLKAHGCEVVWAFESKPTEDQLLAEAPKYDAIISGTEKITARVIDACPRLKVISKHGVGIENIDVKHAKSRGIPVCLAEGSIYESVADMTWALLLALARNVVSSHTDIKAGGWKRFVGIELSGRTLGIIGLGHIGRAVARRARGFGITVLAFDLVQDEAFARENGVTYVSREELLARADFVSLHLNVTPRTRHLANAAFLAQMKPTAMLINSSRGELVDEDALLAALKERRIAGAAVDVFAKEPPGASPLLALDNFIATAHLGGQTDIGLRKMGEVTAENALRVLQGQAPLYQI